MVLAIALLLAPMPNEPTVKRHCTFDNYQTNEYYDGPCLETPIMDASKNFGMVYRFKKQVIKIMFSDEQGQWAKVTINGEIGMRYEIDREHYHFSTLDVNHVDLEVQP